MDLERWESRQQAEETRVKGEPYRVTFVFGFCVSVSVPLSISVS